MLKKVFASLIVGIPILVGAAYAYNVNSEIESVAISAKHESFSNLQELEKNADIILSATKVGAKNIVEKETEGSNKGIIHLFYTLADMKIHKIYKNNTNSELDKNKIIKVLERGAIDKNVLGKQQYIHVEGYELMKQNKKYLLFLRESLSDPGEYIIKGVYYGKIPLDTNELEMTEDGKAKELYSKIVEEAKKKYKE
jgi:hypothetical protein